jgi:hypothetical protein
MDVYGRHALRCGTAGDRTKRHNQLRNFFFTSSVKACLSPILEPTHLLRNCGLKPADWCIPDFTPSKPLACDIAVTDPLRADILHISSISQTGAAQEYGVKVKEAKYCHLIENEDIIFKPIIVETYGGWNTHAVDFIRYLSRNLVQREFHSELANARMVLNRSRSLVVPQDF